MKRGVGLSGVCALSLLTSLPTDVQGCDGASDCPSDSQADRQATHSVPPMELRTTGTVALKDLGSPAFLMPASCDTDGGVFLVPYPAADKRDVRNAPAEPAHRRTPRTVVRVAADGKKTTRFELVGIAADPKSDEMSVAATSVDGRGRLYALVRTRRADQWSQFVVDFDATGQPKSKTEVDFGEIQIDRFAVFGSGDLLLLGYRQQPRGPRIAVMPGTGGALRDVLGLPHTLTEDPTLEVSDRQPPPVISRAETGSDGRAYFVRAATKPVVYAVTDQGDMTEVLELAATPRDASLTDFKVSGQRLAAIYFKERSGEEGPRWWVNTYDLVLGEQVASCGPLAKAVLCYWSMDSQDRFTLFGGDSLLQVSP